MTRPNGRAPTSHPAQDALRAAQLPAMQDPTVTMATSIVNGVVQGVVGGLANVLQQIPLRQHRLCAPCFIALRRWEDTHKAQIGQAGRAMAEAIEADETASRNVADYLSEQLRAQIPAVQFAVTSVGGTQVCELHVTADHQAGQKPGLLLATPHLDMRALARGAERGE